MAVDVSSDEFAVSRVKDVTAVRTKPLRLCIVCEEFYPEDRGGLGTQAFELAKYLVANSVDLRVVSRKGYPESADEETLEGIFITRLPPTGISKGKGWHAVIPTLRFLATLTVWLARRAKQYDALFVFGVKGTLLPTMFIAKVLRKRCFIKVDAAQDLLDEVAPESLGKMGLSSGSAAVRAWKAMRGFLFRRADAVIAISQEICSLLRLRGLPESKLRFIPNGIDLQRFAPATLEMKSNLRMHLNLEGQPLAIYTGRLSRAKGLLLMLDAWKSFVASQPQAHLLIVGSGTGSYDDCENELKEFVAAQRLEHHVTFVGQVDNVTSYLQAADFFVFCSHTEGFGLSLAEAMAAGLPCISTPVGFAPDVIVHGVNGLIVPIDDRDALAKALTWVTSHRAEWDVIGKAAREQVVARYDINAVGRLYLQLLNSSGELAPAH